MHVLFWRRTSIQVTNFSQQGSKFTGATALIAPSYTSVAPSDGKIADTQGPKMTPRSWEQSKVKSTVKWVTSSRHLVNSSILTVIFDLVQIFKTQLAWNHRIKATKLMSPHCLDRDRWSSTSTLFDFVNTKFLPLLKSVFIRKLKSFLSIPQS